MNSRIVVGMTNTDAGRRALAWAVDRAHALKESLLLVSIVGGATGAVGEGKLLDAASGAIEDYLETEATRLRAEGLDVEVEVRKGNPITHLAAASDGAGLLVIGSDFSHGGGRRRGQHGVRIVAAAQCPAVVVGPLGDAPRSGVVVGVDGSGTSTSALRFAAREADRLGEPLIVISVWTPVEVPSMPMLDTHEYLASMQAGTEEMQSIALAGLSSDFPDLVITKEVKCGYPSHIISDRAATARLAVVGSHGRGAFARFLLGSISQEVLLNLTSPTAVIR